ncbi:hypothetical protein BGZ68_006779 [Mortierella alpina]|nr:hypothetical protein BGZ68_006779 [Mortierella alpina]
MIYIIQLEGASVRFDIEPKVTKVIRSDIWGLFGSTEAEQEYSIETLWIPLSTNNYSIIDVYLAQGSHNDTQILVTSIPRAFADWGGAFSVAWAIFFFFFGAPRVDPFGIISRLIGRKTQRYVTTFYGQWLSKPQESPFKSPTIQRTFTAQLSFLNEKTAQDMHSKSCKGSANTSLDITADDAADVAVREQQDESNIEVQMEQTADVKKLKADFDNLQKDFHKLHQLLKDYYLEMDLTVTETETEIESLPSTDVRRWYRRFWPHISPAGDGKSSPVTPPENAAKEA